MLRIFFITFSFFFGFKVYAQSLTYHLEKVDLTQNVLFIFPGFGADAESTLSEFELHREANDHHLSIVYLDFNQHLFLTHAEKEYLAKEMSLIREQHFPEANSFIAGFSSGGTIALSLCEYLLQSENQLQLKGLMMVDSPIDLNYLYGINKKNIERNYSAIAFQESMYINGILKQKEEETFYYEKYNLYDVRRNDFSNIQYCVAELPILIFTENATNWWRENRGNESNETNYFVLKTFTKNALDRYESAKVLIHISENKGFRKNGKRHPHSWSIVDKKLLLSFIDEKYLLD